MAMRPEPLTPLILQDLGPPMHGSTKDEFWVYHTRDQHTPDRGVAYGLHVHPN